MEKPKIIVVYSPGQPFITRALSEIIKESGYSFEVLSPPALPINKTDFIIVEVDSYSKEEELEADLIFTNYFYDASNDLIMWMRSLKHAYCMFATEHPMGLHNYNNFKNFILPMTFRFKPMDFRKCNPSKLIEALRPIENVQES